VSGDGHRLSVKQMAGEAAPQGAQEARGLISAIWASLCYGTLRNLRAISMVVISCFDSEIHIWGKPCDGGNF
jgi:hypothetical protein